MFPDFTKLEKKFDALIKIMQIQCMMLHMIGVDRLEDAGTSTDEYKRARMEQYANALFNAMNADK